MSDRGAVMGDHEALDVPADDGLGDGESRVRLRVTAGGHLLVEVDNNVPGEDAPRYSQRACVTLSHARAIRDFMVEHFGDGSARRSAAATATSTFDASKVDVVDGLRSREVDRMEQVADVVRVVSAAPIRKDDGVKRVLLGQRCAGGSYPLRWCTLGGKVEPGETQIDALHAELREEAKLRPPPSECTPRSAARWWAELARDWSVLFTYRGTSSTTGRPFELTCFTVIASGRFEALAPDDGVVGLGWFTADEVAALSLAAADDANRDKLLAVLR